MCPCPKLLSQKRHVSGSQSCMQFGKYDAQLSYAQGLTTKKQVMHDVHAPKPKTIHAGTWTDNRSQSHASRIAKFPA